MGVTTSVSNEVGGLLKDWLKNPLNASFVYWYFLPALGFVLLQLFVITPALGYSAPEVVPQKDSLQTDSIVAVVLQLLRGSVFWLMLLPLMIGLVMSSLSGTTLRLYRGTLPVVRWLFLPWLQRNRLSSSKMFSDLLKLRRQYLFLSSGISLEIVDGEEKTEVVDEGKRPEKLDQLKLEIQQWHERFETNLADASQAKSGTRAERDSNLLETTPPERELPMDLDRVGPNRFANTLAVAEEYPFERYCMDASVFWPRVSAEMEPEKLDSLTTSYGAMRGFLNLSLLAGGFALECLFVGAGIWFGKFYPLNHAFLRPRWLFVTAVLSVLIGLGAYRAAIGVARSVGNAMRTAFDYYRGNVLRRFNLQVPNDIEEERLVWLKLAAFLRRGESFYFPNEFRSEAKD